MSTAQAQRTDALNQLVKIVDFAAASAADHEETCLSRFHALLSYSKELEILGIGSLTRDRFESLMQLQAFDTAAFEMIGIEAGLIVSRGAYGSALASLVIPGIEDEVTARGATNALALVGAMALAILAGHSAIERSA